MVEVEVIAEMAVSNPNPKAFSFDPNSNSNPNSLRLAAICRSCAHIQRRTAANEAAIFLEQTCRPALLLLVCLL